VVTKHVSLVEFLVCQRMGRYSKYAGRFLAAAFLHFECKKLRSITQSRIPQRKTDQYAGGARSYSRPDHRFPYWGLYFLSPT